MSAKFSRNFFFWLVAIVLVTGCRTPQETPASTATAAQEILATRNPIVLPTLLPTLTPRSTSTASTTPLPSATFTASATRIPPTNTPTADPNASPTPTPTLDPVSLYEQSVPLCEAAFELTSTVTISSTLPGTHLPVFVLLNQAGDSTLWEPVQGMEWVDAEQTSDVRAIVCLRQTRRLDATYADQALGYTLRWDVHLVSWPEGWLIGSETFWGDGPPLQNPTGGTIYGTAPTERLLAWIACDLHPQPFTTLCGSGGPLAFSPDSQKLIVGKDAWDVTSGQITATISDETIPTVLALSPDGSLVASAGARERDIHLWQSDSGETVRILNGHRGEVTGLAFSPDGAWLLSASQEGSLFVWDVQSGERKFVLAENLGWLHTVTISPDGRLAAAATWSQPGLIYLWDWQAALQANAPIAPLHTLEASEIFVTALAFSPDNLLLASAGLDGNIKLWDVASAHEVGASVRMVGLLQGHSESVTGLAFSPDGKSLASGSADTTVIIWDVTKGTARRKLPGAPESVNGVAYSPDGAWLAVSSGGLIRLWPSP